jgi:hypothetical protein
MESTTGYLIGSLQGIGIWFIAIELAALLDHFNVPIKFFSFIIGG